MLKDADSNQEPSGDGYDGWYDEYDAAREAADSRAYWRRRFFILCGGVLALGACAWLFPGAHQPSASSAAATRESVAALNSRQALPSAAFGRSWPVPTPSPTLTPSLTASARLANAAKRKPATVHRPHPVSGASGGACAPASIVLSLLSGQPSYAKGAHPRFSVYAVSTSAGECTLPYGPGSVQVVVTRAGHVVWDSAACRPPAAKPVKFTLGVPQVLTIVWDPAAAKPAGCAGSLPSGASGTLDAVAMSDGQSSPVHTFKLKN